MCPLQQPPLQNVNMQRASAGLAMFSSVVLDRALPLTLLHTNHRNTNKRTLAVCAPLHPCAAYNRTQYNRTTPTIVHPLALCEPTKHQSETDSVSPSTQRAMPNWYLLLLRFLFCVHASTAHIPNTTPNTSTHTHTTHTHSYNTCTRCPPCPSPRVYVLLHRWAFHLLYINGVRGSSASRDASVAKCSTSLASALLPFNTQNKTVDQDVIFVRYARVNFIHS